MILSSRTQVISFIKCYLFTIAYRNCVFHEFTQQQELLVRSPRLTPLQVYNILEYAITILF